MAKKIGTGKAVLLLVIVGILFLFLPVIINGLVTVTYTEEAEVEVTAVEVFRSAQSTSGPTISSVYYVCRLVTGGKTHSILVTDVPAHGDPGKKRFNVGDRMRIAYDPGVLGRNQYVVGGVYHGASIVAAPGKDSTP